MTPIGIAIRAAAIALVVFTFYNPTVFCFWNVAYHSVTRSPDTVTWGIPYIVLGVAAYIAAAAYLVRATHNGIGVWGVLIVVGVLAALVWVLDYMIRPTWHSSAAVWVVEVCLAFILFFGLIYPALNRRLSGQVTTTQGAAIDAHIHHG